MTPEKVILENQVLIMLALLSLTRDDPSLTKDLKEAISGTRNLVASLP